MIFISIFQAFCVEAGYQLNENSMMKFENTEYQLHAYLLVYMMRFEKAEYQVHAYLLVCVRYSTQHIGSLVCGRSSALSYKPCHEFEKNDILNNNESNV